MKIKEISPQKHKFLQRLEYIALKPKILYYYGKMPECDSFGSEMDGFSARLGKFEEGRPPTVAIVGSRKMTAYGKEWAYRAAYELAKEGFVVVSGLALGCDAMGHRGALDAGGRTIGILGTPIDRMYPSRNRGLAQEIIEHGGAIMSECPPFGSGYRGECDPGAMELDLELNPEELAKWKKMMYSKNGTRVAFLRRNRLISGLADAVIVVEADLRSGSLNTAAHAMEQGRLLFAMPGDISRQMSRGCNALFGKGAMAYTSVDDVLDELFLRCRKKKKKEIHGETPEEDAILLAMKTGLVVGDEIFDFVCEKTGVEMDISTFSQTLTMLEIKGYIRRLEMNNWALKDG